MFSLRIFFGKDQNQNFRTKRKAFKSVPNPFGPNVQKRRRGYISGILQYTKVTNHLCVEKLDFWDGIFFWGVGSPDFFEAPKSANLFTVRRDEQLALWRKEFKGGIGTIYINPRFESASPTKLITQVGKSKNTRVSISLSGTANKGPWFFVRNSVYQYQWKKRRLSFWLHKNRQEKWCSLNKWIQTRYNKIQR